MTFKVMVVNRSATDQADLFHTVRAINTQLRTHFGPAWNIDSSCFLQYKRKEPHDAVIYLEDKPTIDDAAGYHDKDKEGMPFGFVFLDICASLGESYSVTLSHEILELVLNRHCNYFAIGKHPRNKKKRAAIWMEACDPVQDQSYKINGVEVSDFLFPLYFTPEAEAKGQNNYMKDKPVESFGVNPGGYVGYYDFDLKSDETWFPEEDERARKRQVIKSHLGSIRRKSRVKLLLENAGEDIA
jgi:hypothetical protein